MINTNILKGLVVTEKGLRHAPLEGGSDIKNKVYVFKVEKDATKPKIKSVIENVFDVKVKSINTLITKGKNKMFKGRAGKRSDVKKAYVTLESGEIDIRESV